MFAPDDSDLGAPAFVEGEEVPFDAGGEVLEDDLRGWVDVEGGGDQVEARGERGEFEAAEVAVALELAKAFFVSGLQVVVTDADPVVEALQGEVEVVVGFEFDDGEAAVGGDA